MTATTTLLLKYFLSYACLLVVGFLTTRHIQFILALALIYSLVVIGLVILIGYAGLVSFGQGAFYAIGGYSVGLMIKYFGIQNAEILLILGILTSTVMSLIIGLACTRTRRIAFAMITLAFGMIIYTILLKFYRFTGGTDGLRIPLLKFGGVFPVRGYSLSLFNLTNEYFIIITVFIFILFLSERFIHSPISYTLRAIKDAEVKAVSLGISPAKAYLIAFIYAGFLAGLAGTLYAFLNAHIDPNMTYWTTSAEFVFITILGGGSGIPGAIFASILFLFLKTYLIAYTAYYWQFAIGIIFLLIILLAPSGLTGIIDKITRSLKKALTKS
jgi:branched-chain amino acid transport system permease protein